MNDLKFAFRQLVKNPGFTAVAVLTLGLGIGANTALFSLINAMLMRPLPGVVEPEGLVRLTHGSFSYAKFEALKAQQVFAQTVAFDLDRLPAEVNGALQSSRVMLVSGDYFHALGVNARLGRTITPQDDQAQALVAVLSHSFWTHAFAADPGVIGRSFRVSGLAVTIIGVTPPALAPRQTSRCPSPPFRSFERSDPAFSRNDPPTGCSSWAGLRQGRRWSRRMRGSRSSGRKCWPPPHRRIRLRLPTSFVRRLICSLPGTDSLIFEENLLRRCLS